MKKIMKICFLVIMAFTFLFSFKTINAETYNVNDDVNLGQYNIYYRQGASYIRYKGIGQLNYLYFYKDYNNTEHKAYCLNLGMTGAEGGDYIVDANRLITDSKVASILVSGSPYKTPQELGVQNEDEAQFATQFAVWAYLKPLDLNQIAPYTMGNQEHINVVNAIKKIYNDGIALSNNYTTEALLHINKEGNADIDNLNREYYSQKFTISHNSNVKNISLSTMGIDNIKIVDLNNREIGNINDVSEFKVLIPRASVTQDKELLLNFRTETKQTSVMFGATTLSDRQNMGLMLDPVNFRTIQDRFNVKYVTSKINLKKIDIDTKEPIPNVKFKFETLNGENLGEFTTNNNGIIELDAQKDLNILKEQKIKVTEISVPDNYTINEDNSQIIDIVWGKNVEIQFENEHKKGNIKVYKVDKDNNKVVLGNVEFQLYSKEFKRVIGTYTTDVNGEIFIENLRTGEYSLIETKTNKWYNLTSDTEIEVKWNLTKEVQIENELKKGSIKVYKVDKDNNEVRLANVKFNVLDKDGNILEQIITDKNGEATTKQYSIRDFEELKLQEVETLDTYVLDNEIHTIKLEENQIKDVTFENEKIKGQIQVIKVSADDNKLTGDKKGTPLEGAVFEVYNSNNELVDTLTTDCEGKAISKLLVKGEYYLKEVDSGSPYYLVNSDIFKAEIKEHKEIVDVPVEEESVDIDVEIEKKGFKETQSKDSIFYDFSNIHNKSNVALNNFTWTDILPTNALRANKIYTGTWNQDLTYSIWYKTNKNDYKMLVDNLSTQVNNEVNFKTADLENDEYITEFEFRFGTVEEGFREIEKPRLYCDMLEGLGNGFVFINHVKVFGEYEGKYVEDKDDWTTITYYKEIQLKKLPKTGC